MELWIRSQDKRHLLNCEAFLIEGVGNNRFGIRAFTKNYDFNIGNYATKERALEVLDEIQRILMPNIMSYSPIVESKEDFKNHCMKTELCGYTTEYDVIVLSTYIYEMPKD